MKTMMQKSVAKEFRNRYFGLVIDNLTCKDSNTAHSLATLMGEYLFYHIVDASDTAARIISEFNRANLPGEVNFFVLDIIESNECSKCDGIISRFGFDAKYQKVFEQIFHEMPENVKDMWSKSAGDFDGIASQLPDVIEKDGALIATISAVSSANNSIDLYEKHQSLLELDEATRYERSENAYRMDATICSIDETSKTLSNQYNTVAAIQNIDSRLAQTNRQMELCENHVATLQSEMRQIESKVKELTDTKDRYENELKLEQLLQAEKAAIERVQILINDKKMELTQVYAEMKALNAKRDNVMQFFDQTLMSRYSAIEESAKEYTYASNELSRKEQELLQYDENKLSLESNLNAVRQQIVDLQKQLDSKKSKLRDLDQLKLDLYQRQNELFIEINETEIMKKTLTNELNQLISIRPPDATAIQNADIIGMDEADVLMQLDIARHQLNTFQNTNCFDINILDKFKRDRANFMRRRAELTRLDAKITAAMNTLDSNIQKTIANTFDDLAKHFALIFEQFVPNGLARLQSIKIATNDAISSTDLGISTIDGIEIFARFPDDIEKRFEDLFEQQRHVVALAFIISMQRLYSAPFYLFDCIDEVKLKDKH